MLAFSKLFDYHTVGWDNYRMVTQLTISILRMKYETNVPKDIPFTDADRKIFVKYWPMIDIA